MLGLGFRAVEVVAFAGLSALSPPVQPPVVGPLWYPTNLEDIERCCGNGGVLCCWLAKPTLGMAYLGVPSSKGATMTSTTSPVSTVPV